LSVGPATSGERPETRPLRLAHRGDPRLAPENSLEAIVLAAGTPGCDGVELDVRVSRDGVPVLLHDATLARVQGLPHAVRDVDAADLRPLGIPTLEVVLEALSADTWLDVELKGDDHGAVTAGILRAARGPEPERAVVSSFDASTLALMADLLPGWPRWLNARDLDPATLSLALGLGCRAVSAEWGVITPASMRRARAAGLDLAAWTVLRPATRDRLERLGVVATCVEAAALDAP
jgi:glycerophosphoryl diester phosphodiesterase